MTESVATNPERSRAQRIIEAVNVRPSNLTIGMLILCEGKPETAMLLTHLIKLTGTGDLINGEIAKSLAEASLEISYEIIAGNSQPKGEPEPLVSIRALRTAKDWLEGKEPGGVVNDAHKYVSTRTAIWAKSPTTLWTVDLAKIETDLKIKAGKYVMFDGEWIEPEPIKYPQATWMPYGKARTLLELFYRKTANFPKIEPLSFGRQDADRAEAEYWVQCGMTPEMLEINLDWHIRNQGRSTIVRPTSLHKNIKITIDKCRKASGNNQPNSMPAWVPADMRALVDAAYQESGVWPSREAECAKIWPAWKNAGIKESDIVHACNWRKFYGQEPGVVLRVKSFESLGNIALVQARLARDFGSGRRPSWQKGCSYDDPQILYFRAWDVDKSKVIARYPESPAPEVGETSEAVGDADTDAQETPNPYASMIPF